MSDKNSNLTTLAANIKQGVNTRLKELHTSMPGIIVSFDPTAQLASVQPAIKRIFKTDDGEKEILIAENLPILINVLVQFPRGGGFSLTFPVATGDECLLVFCERSIDTWHKFGTVREPGARRFHALSDATAFVGLSSIPNKIPDYDPVNVQLKKDDGSAFITLKQDEIEMESDTLIKITAPDIKLYGHVTNNDINISSTHVHSQGNDSDGDSEVDTDGPH